MDKYKKAFDNMKVSPEILERARREAGKAGNPEMADKASKDEVQYRPAEMTNAAAGFDEKVKSMESARRKKRNIWSLGAAAACFALVAAVWAAGGLPVLNTPVSEEIGHIKGILSVEEEPENVYLGISENGEAVVKYTDSEKNSSGARNLNGTEYIPGNASGGSSLQGAGSTKTEAGISGKSFESVNDAFSGGDQSGDSDNTKSAGDHSGTESPGEELTTEGESGDQESGIFQGQTLSEVPEAGDGSVVMTSKPGVEGNGASETQTPVEETENSGLQGISNLTEAEAVLGCKPKIPSGIPSGFSVENINVISGKLLSITYVKGSVRAEYRWERASADISGDYNNYSYSSDLVKGSRKYVLRGGSENDIRNITCIGGSESCSYVFETPVNMTTAMKWISALD